jgi:acyl-CoA synthetase (AMP-forming)/AMP-acid ligase II
MIVEPSACLDPSLQKALKVVATYLEATDGISAGTTLTSWLPVPHDTGLLLCITAPVATGLPALSTSPIAFPQKPGRWMHTLASHRLFSGRSTSLSNWQRDAQ